MNQELINKIKDILPQEKKEDSYYDTPVIAYSSKCDINDGYNSAIRDTYKALPDMINCIYEDLRFDIKSIKEKVREQTGSFKYDSCYDDILRLLEIKEK